MLDRDKEGAATKEHWINEFLGSFKVASYDTAEKVQEEEEEVEEPVNLDPNYWEKLIKPSERPALDPFQEAAASIPKSLKFGFQNNGPIE